MSDDIESYDVDFDCLGGELSSKFEQMLAGPNPYTGSIPWLVAVDVHQIVIDDEFVVKLTQPGRERALHSRKNSTRYELEETICEYLAPLCALPPCLYFTQLIDTAAAKGYRFLLKSTGLYRGLTHGAVLMADSISELDAALQLDSSIDTILDLLDAGHDPMRKHVTFGTPFDVAKRKATVRPEYNHVVSYMRACGAHG